MKGLTTIAQLPRTGAGCAAALKAEVPKALKPAVGVPVHMSFDMGALSGDMHAVVVVQIIAAMRRPHRWIWSCA